MKHGLKNILFFKSVLIRKICGWMNNYNDNPGLPRAWGGHKRCVIPRLSAGRRVLILLMTPGDLACALIVLWFFPGMNTI